MPARSAPATRSQLYVPGNRGDWFEKAVATGADGLILDLEDSVPPEEKAEARELVATFIGERGPGSRPITLVRVNAADSPDHLDDVLAVVAAGVDSVVLPKAESAADVIALDGLITAAELRCERERGSTLITPILETAAAIRGAYELALASPRVAYMGGMSSRGGDIERGVGFRWSPGGAETVGFRARTLLDARAAGVPNPVTGTWTELEDLAAFEAFAEEGRDLGYEGMALIHPSHVAVANRVFSPAPEELDRDRRLIEAMEAAEAAGSAAVRFEGGMVDIAMVTLARRRLARAEELAAG